MFSLTNFAYIPLPERARTAAVEAYRAGEPVASIARRLGMSKTTINILARRAGLKTRNPLPEDVDTTVVEAYRAGEPVASIARRLDISKATVNTLARKADLQARISLPEEVRVAVVEAYKTGEPVANIVRRFSISRATVRNLARKAGLEARRVSLPEEVHMAVIEAYRAGEPATDIARRLDISKATVNTLARRAGLEARIRYTTPEERIVMVEAYKAGEPLLSIAQRFGITPSTVAYIARRAHLRVARSERAIRSIPAEVGRDVLTRYKRGELIEDVARLHNLSRESVICLVRKAGLRRTKILSHAQRSDIVQRYIAGEPPSSIAERYRLSGSGRVVSIARQAGIPPLYLTMPFRFTPTERAKLGAQFCAISRKFSLTPSSALRVAKKFCPRKNTNPSALEEAPQVAKELCAIAEDQAINIANLYTFAVPICGDPHIKQRCKPEKHLAKLPPKEIERLHTLFEHRYGYRP